MGAVGCAASCGFAARAASWSGNGDGFAAAGGGRTGAGGVAFPETAAGDSPGEALGWPGGVCGGRAGIVALACGGGEFNSRGDPAGSGHNFGGGVATCSAPVAPGDALGFTTGGIGRAVAAGELAVGDVGVTVALDAGTRPVGCGVAEARGVAVGRGDKAGREAEARGVGGGEALRAADAVALAIGVIDERGVAVARGVGVATGGVAVAVLRGAVAAGAVAAALAGGVAEVAGALGAAVRVSALATAFAGALAGGVASAITFARAWSAAALFEIPDQPFSTTALLICLFTAAGR